MSKLYSSTKFKNKEILTLLGRTYTISNDVNKKTE